MVQIYACGGRVGITPRLIMAKIQARGQVWQALDRFPLHLDM